MKTVSDQTPRRVASSVFACSLLVFSLAVWVPEGLAEGPEEPADPATYGIEVTEDHRSHWSFQKLSEAVPPELNSDWVRDPLDAFVLKALQEKKLSPAEDAAPRVWLRRVYIDLIGIPPTPSEMEEFLSNPSNEMREKVVDKLLNHPGYGVRWGRRWLDVVRYADTNGYERDGDKPSVWRYRDYVVDAFNKDKPFNRFVLEQLAGDELEDANAESMIATTYLRLGTWDDEPADPKVDRYEQLDEIVKNVSTTFLGLTVACARCHNHKFEPISQIDYTRFLACFEPLNRPQNGRTDNDVHVGSRAELQVYNEALKRHQESLEKLQEQLNALDVALKTRFLNSGKSTLTDEQKSAHLISPEQRTEPQKQLVKDSEAKLAMEIAQFETETEKRQRTGLNQALAAIRESAPVEPARGYIWEENVVPVATMVFKRGDPEAPVGTVTPGIPSVLDTIPFDLLPPAPGTPTTGRRLSLARWLTRPDHPLVPRVFVNRIWQWHFGEGLVRTENDYGVMGYSPSHPELLDYLVSEFIKGGWSIKALHRRIVLSRTYGLTSRASEQAMKTDPGNELLSHYPSRRIDAESYRDSVLFVSGQLNEKLGGPGVYPKLSAEVLASQSRPGSGWGKSSPEEASRRSIYVFVKRSLLVPELELLDLPDTTCSCEQRNVSTIPTQALTLMNGAFIQQQSEHFARRLLKDASGDRAKQITLAFSLAFGREPDAEERALAETFLTSQLKLLTEEKFEENRREEKALSDWCLVLFNLNEFAYVD